MSSLLFWDYAEQPLTAPLEWQAAWIALPDNADLNTIVRYHDQILTPMRRYLAGQERTVINWSATGTGQHCLQITGENYTFTILPRKITLNAYKTLLFELETRLPNNIALSLQKTGGFTDVVLQPATDADNTLAAELALLKVLLYGGVTSKGRRLSGVLSLLPHIATAPHQTLQGVEHLVSSTRARRLSPTHFTQCIQHLRPPSTIPSHVIEATTRINLDGLENRLLKTLLQQLQYRLQRLMQLSDSRVETAAHAMHNVLQQAMQKVSWLNQIKTLMQPPTSLTSTLSKNPTYQAVYQHFLHLQQHVQVTLDTPVLTAPLENLPQLYQLWCTLQVLDAVLNFALQQGYRLQHQQLYQRDASGWWLRSWTRGQVLLALQQPDTGTHLQFIAERHYSGNETLSAFAQRPDMALEQVHADGSKAILLFDAKYKLDSDANRPQKADMDKMHAYRDAIVHNGQPVVRYAAILYPGDDYLDAPQVQALRANPVDSVALQVQLLRILQILV